MHYEIVYDEPGRLRVRCGKWVFTDDEACGVTVALRGVEGVTRAMVRYANGSILVEYGGGEPTRRRVEQAIAALDVLDLPTCQDDDAYTLAKVDNDFQMELASTIAMRVVRRLILPPPIRMAITLIRAARFIYKGLRSLLRGRIDVPVLDATAITCSLLQGDFKTAGSVMFMLRLSDVLANYTQSRTRCALRQSLTVCAEAIWLVRSDGTEISVQPADLREGDVIRVRTGSMIPLDGRIVGGEGEVNEASMTGESALVHKKKGHTVFAGTIVDEGCIDICVSNTVGSSRIDGIVDMVENSQELKASAQSRAEVLADSIVPFSLGMFFAELALSRNITRAMSVLMVDYSCAIKLSMPIAVMSAMREATGHRIVAKGGKYLEALARADAIVFDKTGTLTNASPQVCNIITFGDMDEREVLRLAACLEEHFPHSMARAIVKKADEMGAKHAGEVHGEVEYIVAHGIASSVEGKKVRIGSAHFVFEDEKVRRPRGLRKRLDQEAPAASTVFMAVDGKLAGAICIEDPLREESADVIARLRDSGFGHIVMLTGDSENCAAAVASKLGIDEYRSQVLPEDKASYVSALKDEGHTVVMIGDGINDSPALAAADVSIALSDASDIARSVADISVLDPNLESVIVARRIAERLMGRIDASYRFIIAFNTALIALGLAGVMAPPTAALFHNFSTFALSAANTRPLISDREADRIAVAQSR